MVEDIAGIGAVVLVTGALGVRVLPATRRRAPRGRCAAAMKHIHLVETSPVTGLRHRARRQRGEVAHGDA